MSLVIERDVDGDSQQSSFQNATLQNGPPGYEFSIAVSLDVPRSVHDQDTLEAFIKDTLGFVALHPYVTIHVQMGPEEGG